MPFRPSTRAADLDEPAPGPVRGRLTVRVRSVASRLGRSGRKVRCGAAGAGQRVRRAAVDLYRDRRTTAGLPGNRC
ncbi:hypothetical protein HNR25_001147 [Streptomonospora salina]|uniref:Uncharacterized protein n=1 Tax=Streptomonospora salina TaxID=104205 RepID=A0A841E2Y2_9ACTN|nr:hypothetical protein [Streptomonospora salina]